MRDILISIGARISCVFMILPLECARSAALWLEMTPCNSMTKVLAILAVYAFGSGFQCKLAIGRASGMAFELQNVGTEQIDMNAVLSNNAPGQVHPSRQP
jgi:hypothetical protein